MGVLLIMIWGSLFAILAIRETDRKKRRKLELERKRRLYSNTTDKYLIDPPMFHQRAALGYKCITDVVLNPNLHTKEELDIFEKKLKEGSEEFTTFRISEEAKSLVESELKERASYIPKKEKEGTDLSYYGPALYLLAKRKR